MKKESNYVSCWNYIKKSRNYFYAVGLAFIVAVLAGFFYPYIFEETIKKLIEALAKQVEGMNFFQLFIFIFKNNLRTAFFGMLFGVVFVFPLLAILFNGYILGFVASFASKEHGFAVLLRILPHGIFEIPALFLSLGLGLKLGMFIFVKNKKKYLRENFEACLGCFVYVIIPLLLIAAGIEAGLMVVLG